METLIIGNKVYFAEEGQEVDGVTVSATAYPDVDPASNWMAFGKIYEAAVEPTYESHEEWECDDNGDYRKVTKKRVVGWVYKFKSNTPVEQFFRMAFGLKNKVVDGTSQTPFTLGENTINGWVKAEKKQGGVNKVVMNVWGELSIDENPKYSKDPTKPGYQLQLLYSPIATLEPNGIAAA